MPTPKIKRICLLSQAAKANGITRQAMSDHWESVPDLEIIMPLSEIKYWPDNISRDIKAHREILEEDGPTTIPNLQAMATKLKQVAAWMKAEGFTHFIDDIWNHDVGKY